MTKKRPIYYDTETTGVKTDRDRIVEIAAYDPVLDRTFVSFINPQIAIPPASTAVHNITDDMVANSPLFGEVAKQFVEFCHGDVVLIAHNNDSFDQPFLKCEFDRHSVPFPTWDWLDSLKWARKYRPDLPRHSLQHLREIFGFAANNAHRALDDVIILHKVFSLLIDDIDMETALELMKEQPKTVRNMPFGKHAGKPLKEVPASYIKWLNKEGAFDKPENAPLKEALISLGII